MSARLRTFAWGFLCLAFSVASHLAIADSALDRGTAWLGAQPQANGSLAGENSSLALAFQSRAETLTTLRQLVSVPTPLADAVSQDGGDTSEQLARKAIALAPLGRDVSSALATLAARQNADGGFGGAPGYQSNALDTAYVLEAFKAGSFANANAIAAAIGYLNSTQATDGSFSIQDTRSVYVTSHALQALGAFAQSNPVATQVASARAWLIAQQGTAGYPTVVENATAVVALLATSTDTAPLAAPIAAINAAQSSSDGSWSDDPYVTALALRALGAATGEATGSVVDDATNAPIAGVLIQLSGAEAASATSDSSGAFLFDGLLPGSYTASLAKPGYTSITTGFAVASALTTNVGTLRLRASTTTASVIGTITDASTGQPIAGAVISAGGVVPDATSDANGAYVLGGIPPSTVTLTVSRTGYQSVTTFATVSAGQAYTFSPSLYATGTSAGSTTLKGKIVARSDAQPIAGATVTVGAIAATTNSTGDFALSGLSPGPASIQVDASGYRTVTLSASLAAGANDVGTIMLDAQGASITVSGKVTSSTTGAAIAGASISITGTSLTTVSDATGNYTLAGVTETTFTLSVAASGYAAQNVAVSLPTLADTTVNVTLNPLGAAGAIKIQSFATDKGTYDPFSVIDGAASLQNTTSQAVVTVLQGVMMNSAGLQVGLSQPVTVTVPAQGTAAAEVELHNGSLPGGNYTLTVRAYDSDAQAILAEATAPLGINAVARTGGAVTLDPPILEAGTSQPVHITASLANYGNVPLAAGPAELTFTLLNPGPDNTNVRTDLLPGLISGGNLNGSVGAGLDAQGNFYTVNAAERRIVKISPAPDFTQSFVRINVAGQSVDTIPATVTTSNGSVAVSPVDMIADAGGTIYILNNANAIFTVTPDGTLGSRWTGLANQAAFDRDSSGNFHIVAGTGSGNTRIETLTASGLDPTASFTSAGLSSPYGITRASDGNFYVANYNTGEISRVTPDGTISVFAVNATLIKNPVGVAEWQGNLYVANGTGGTVVRVPLQGSDAGQVYAYATGLSNPMELRVDRQGNLFATGDVGVYRIPAGGGAAQDYARSILNNPSSLRYDTSGNLYVTNTDQVVRRDTAGKITTLFAGVGQLAELTIAPSGDVYFAADTGRIYKLTAPAMTSQIFTGGGLNHPYGVALDGNGTLYVTEGSGGRILSYNTGVTSPPQNVAAQSLINSPKAVRTDANGNRIVLNGDSITSIPASGAAGNYLVTGRFSAATSFALASDGGYFEQESSVVRKLDSTGAVVWTMTGFNSLANGVVAVDSGTVLVGNKSSSKIVRVANGSVSDVTSTALPAPPGVIVSDGNGGVYAALTSGLVVQVSSQGSVTQITNAAISPAPTGLALDAANHILYFIDGTPGLKSIPTGGGAVASVPGVTRLLGALDFINGQVVATTSATLELVTIAPATGTTTSVAAGFASPKPILWDGTRLVFSTATATLALVPGGNPQIILNEGFDHLALKDGTLYGTRSDTDVHAFRPGIDSSSSVYLTPDAVKLAGFAFRPDGALMVSQYTTGSFFVYDANKQLIEFYPGINRAAGLALDSTGAVYVAAQGNNTIVRIDPTTRQASIYFNNTSGLGLAFDANDNLFETANTNVYQLFRDGSYLKLGGTVDTLRGIVADSSGVYVSFPGAGGIYKAGSGTLTPFALGISLNFQVTSRLRVDPTGGVAVASYNNGSVLKVANKTVSVRASSVPSPQSMVFASNGDLLVGTHNGRLVRVDAANNQVEAANLVAIYSSTATFPMDAMAIDASDTVYSLNSARKQVDRMAYHSGASSAVAGMTFPARQVQVGDIAVGASSATLDLGTWTPPYSGDYQLTLRPLNTSVAGQAANMLHVGPNATATILAASGAVAPGDAPVGLTIQLQGADFVTLAKPDTGSISVVNASIYGAIGVSSSGAIYNASGGSVMKYTAATGQTTFWKTSGSINMRGAIPIDDAQNLYVAVGAVVNRLSPAGSATAIATLPDSVISMARGPGDVIYALLQKSIYKIYFDGQAWQAKALDAAVTDNPPYAITTDGAGNLYVQTTSTYINVYRPDGTRASVIVPDANAEPTFELEGSNIAGDCADNLFITPYFWQRFGQANEEHTLVQLVGRTGVPASIFDANTHYPKIDDMDGLVFDRFSSAFLIANDAGGAFRLPVTCGAVSTDLHMVFPGGQPVAGINFPPKAVIPRADGSAEYIWSFKDVSANGRSVALNTTLPGMAFGETRAVASEAFITFANPFSTSDVLRVDVKVPQVKADGMVDLAVSTDTQQYPANAPVTGTVSITNRDTADRTGTLVLEITDAQGTRIASLGQQSVTLPHGATTPFTASFNTGTYLTGAYVLKATLLATNGVDLGEQGATFYIVTGPDTLLGSVSTDKRGYDPNDTVTITARVRNATLNQVTTGAVVAVTVTNPSGQQVFSGSASIPVLVPQALKDNLFQLKLQQAPAGNYTVTETVTVSGAQVGEAQVAQFGVLSSADTGSGIASAVTVTRKVNRGDPVDVTATLKNLGNAALSSMPVTVQVVDPRSNTVVQQSVSTITLNPGDQQDVKMTWDTTGVAGGTYVGIAFAQAGNTTPPRSVTLGQDSILVGAVQPFAFAPRTGVPVTTWVESDPVTIAGLALPGAIGIAPGSDDAEYRVGTSAWTSTAGTVNPGDTVTVRVLSGGTYLAKTTAKLQVEDFIAGFDVTTVNPDVTPDPFAFDPQGNVPLNSLRTSNTVTISGIDIPVAISISGGEYQVGTGPWTSAAGTVANGNQVTVRLTSASTLGTTTSAHVTISDVSADFTVTTTAEDRIPDPFAFTAITDAQLSTVQVSNQVTINGINVVVPVSITGGEYSLNGAAFTAAAGSVKQGDTIVVRQTSSASFSTKTSVVLTVSTVSASFDVTTAAEDKTPDAFAFTAQTDVPLSTQRTSNQVTITGINTTVPVSITGGTYSLNGAAYTSAPGTVKQGDTITVQQTSSVSFSTKTSAVLTVSTVSASFDVMTVAEDKTPDAFSFVPQTDVPISTLRTSSQVTITGINTTVPVSITGGTYSLNGGAYTSAPGTVKQGDTITVQQTSSASFSTKTSAVLTVSTISASFDVTTVAEDKTPDAFSFVPQTDVPISTLRTSSQVTITGINTTVPVTITGGTYSLNGAAYTNAAGTAKQGDTITVQQTSSASFSTKTSAVLTVSTVSASFDVTTVAEDKTPDAFSFVPRTDVPVTSVQTSEPIQVTGINTTIPVKVTGGAYSINGGAFTSADGTVKQGDYVVVRQTASSSFATKTSAVLTLSTVSASFDVTTVSIANVALALNFTADTRLLVLVSCKNSQGVDDPVCDQQRSAYLDTLLTSLGVQHTLTTDTTPFSTEMRSGRYNTYWISGGAEKLQGTLVEEVREAAFRGESLIADGFHDDRNHFIDEVFGVNYGGHITPSVSSVVLTGSFLPTGTFPYSGDAIRADLVGGSSQAGFDSATGSAAIVKNAYGKGQGILFAFDLVATLMAQQGSALLQATLAQSIDVVVPPVPAAFTGSAYVPFTVSLANHEPVPVDIAITASLAGFTLGGATPAATVSATGDAQWMVSVPANTTTTVTWWYSAPTASGTYSGTTTIEQVYGGARHPLGTQSMQVKVDALEVALPRVIAQLQALTLPITAEAQARDRTVTSLQQAQTAIAQSQYDSAISLLVTAVDQLDPIVSVSVAAQQVDIDRVMQETSRRWYLALPVCPATPVCR